MRIVKTIENQNVYDVAVEQFGTLNNIDKVIRQVSGFINGVIPFDTELTLDATDNNLAIQFEVNNKRFATGATSDIAPLFDVFDDTFDDTFN